MNEKTEDESRIANVDDIIRGIGPVIQNKDADVVVNALCFLIGWAVSQTTNAEESKKAVAEHLSKICDDFLQHQQEIRQLNDINKLNDPDNNV